MLQVTVLFLLILLGGSTLAGAAFLAPWLEYLQLALFATLLLVAGAYLTLIGFLPAPLWLRRFLIRLRRALLAAAAGAGRGPDRAGRGDPL